MKTQRTTLVAFFLLTVALITGNAYAYRDASSDLLLPYFEVDLTGAGKTTYFTVVNAAQAAVPVEITVYTNWGIEILRTAAVLAPDQARTFNLGDWLVQGKLPDRVLGAAELEHCQDAASGQRSPKDDLYYATALELNLAVGYVKIRSMDHPRSRTLFGDYFLVNGLEDSAQGEVLVDISNTHACPGLCNRQGLRFLTGGGFDGTRFVIWTARDNNQPSASAYYPEQKKTGAELQAFKQSGEKIEQLFMGFMPLEVLDVKDLSLGSPFGWIELVSERDVYITVLYSAQNRFSAAVQTSCLPPPPPPPHPPEDGAAEIRIEKSTNGEDADTAPGPTLFKDAAVRWDYVVTNTGDVTLHDIAVNDDLEGAVSCPKSTLEPGESMDCDALTGTAILGQYANVATVTGKSPDDEQVEDTDPSHYEGADIGEVCSSDCISIEKSTNGHDADAAPGPTLKIGDAITWTYVVTNTSDNTTIDDISVTDDQGVAVSCPKSALAAGESMTCTGHGTVTAGPACNGQYSNVGTVIGHSPSDDLYQDTDPSHYWCQPPDPHPGIHVEKSTNGQDADAAPGPTLEIGDAITWTYVVTNTGDVALDNISVTDDQGVAVSCPKSSLAPGESMTCTGHGTVTEGPACDGQYSNVGTAIGYAPNGQSYEDSDSSHYFCEPPEPPEPQDWRMTGGGSVFTGGQRYTHGFELHCDRSEPNNLEINWGGNSFHLLDLESAACSDDPAISEAPPVAGFDTFVGQGTGRLNGEAGASISFKFTDAGEPGKDVDLAEFTITPPGGGTPIVVSGYLEKGNQQAHGN